MTQQTLFHVTPLRNLGRIRAEGLLAQLGPRASAACERAPAVFCFPSREDLDNALSNWMGEDFEDSPGELAIVELRSPLSAKRDACAASYEVVLLDPVPSHAIVAAYRDDWSPIDHFHAAPHEVPAEVHTDEHTVTVHFDASHALRSMTDKQILDLAREEFRTSSEYVRELIRRDQDRLQLRNLLLAGASSAPTAPVNETYFEGLRERVRGAAQVASKTRSRS